MLSDEELDDARMREAMRRMGSLRCPGVSQEQAARWGARLAREGWMPPDPLDREVDALYDRELEEGGTIRDALRKALERGIEIGIERAGPKGKEAW